MAQGVNLHSVPSPSTVRRLRSHQDRLVSSVLARIDGDYAWYRSLPAEQRSFVSLVVQASISAFINWCEKAESAAPTTVEIFAAAPAELTQVVSLQQTLQLVRKGVAVIEDEAETLAAPGQADELRDALLHYSREFAFAAAEVYARAAEIRGSWDARLEALLVDGLLRGEDGRSLASRAAALGWTSTGPVICAVASVESPLSSAEGLELRRAVRRSAPQTLLGIQADRVVIVLGGAGDLAAAVAGLCDFLGAVVVIGPLVPNLETAARSLRAAWAGLDAAPGWPTAPRPVQADDLLPERVLSGDPIARITMIETTYQPLVDAGGELVETLWAYFATGRSLEAAARMLIVHPNTVRYRLKRVAQVSAWDAHEPRESYVLHVALTVGRLAEGRVRVA